MTTKTSSGRSARTNSWVAVLGVLGILVLLNVIGAWVFGKADVTDNARYTLSDVSRDAIAALDEVDVQVFVSKDLPPTVSAGYGRERDIRGVGRELLDKLAEYQSYSGGRMTVTQVRDDIEEKAAQARLELFTGKSAQVEGGRLEFQKYAIGATFQYRDQMEVFPLALEPETFEFEITRILLRLKEKYEKSTGMKDLLDAGTAVAEATRACSDQLESYRKKGTDKNAALGALVGGGDLVSALRVDRAAFNRTCDAVGPAVARAEGLKGKNENLDQLANTARGFVELLGEMGRQLDDPAGGQAALVAERMIAVRAAVDKEHDLLRNAPGRKAIGFLCGHREFCPFPDAEPLIRPEIAGMLGQQNPLAQQFVHQAMQIENQIHQINEQLRRGLFVRRGLNLKRIDPGQDIPDDVAVLVIHGPQTALSDRDRYNVDQFLLSGRSVIVFAGNYDVAVYNIRTGGQDLGAMSDMTFDALHQIAYPTNIAQMLANYGVKLNSDLVVEPKSFEPITIMQLERQGQFTLQSQREFPYPLLPTFSDMDRGHVLVRRLESITMPYVSTMSELSLPGVTVTPLVRTSPEASATSGDLRLSPPELLQQIPGLPKNGPHIVAMVSRGTFTSAFAGKPVPSRPDEGEKGPNRPQPAPVERPFRERGEGRLLVVGSTLGLENLSTDKVFDGFKLSDLSSGNADFFMKLKDYVAAFQNWQVRLAQVSPIVQANLDFIYNCLDWGVQNEALVDIRSKGMVRRPIVEVSSTGQTAIALSVILGVPLLFVLGGAIRFATRRRKG